MSVCAAADSLPEGRWQQCGLAARTCGNVLLFGEGGEAARATERTR